MRGYLYFGIIVLVSGCVLGHETFANFSGSPTTSMIDVGVSLDQTPIPDSSNSMPTQKMLGNKIADPASLQNTRFCKVDAHGKVESADLIHVTTSRVLDGLTVFDGLGGGCVSRPIREVWAVILNIPAMKAPDLDEHRLIQAHPDLVDFQKGTFFVYDIESIVRRLAGIIQIKWTTRWYHSVTIGDYLSPRQIVINFQKISGSAHVDYDREGYTLDRVGPNMTSFAMRQMIKATQVDSERVRLNISRILKKVRSGAPDWAALPVLHVKP